MSAENQESKCCCQINLAFAHLLARLWIGMRLFMAGLDKFRAGDGADSTFNMDNYHSKTDRIASLMTDHSFLPKALVNMYATPIGFILLLVGLWVVVGFFTEFSLLIAGFTVLSLGFGLAALPDDTEVVYIGVHILVIVAALVTSKANKLSIDGLIFRKRD